MNGADAAILLLLVVLFFLTAYAVTDVKLRSWRLRSRRREPDE